MLLTRGYQGDLAGALRCFIESEAIHERLATSDPANATWQRDLSYCLTRLAQVCMQQQNWDEALVLMERSLRIDERLSASDPTNVRWQEDVRVSRRILTQFREKLAT